MMGGRKVEGILKPFGRSEILFPPRELERIKKRAKAKARGITFRFLTGVKPVLKNNSRACVLTL